MPRRFSNFQEAFDDLHDKSVEEYLRQDAKLQGLTWADYCYKYDIIGGAQQRRIWRHEVAEYKEIERDTDEDTSL